MTNTALSGAVRNVSQEVLCGCQSSTERFCRLIFGRIVVQTLTARAQNPVQHSAHIRDLTVSRECAKIVKY
jgi:hypothetical protein